MVAGGDAGGGKGWVARDFFFFLSLGGWIYTHLAGSRRSVHCFRNTVHSTPPPIHGPSFSHSVAFSLDRPEAHAHIIITLYSLSLSLFRPRILFLFVLSRSLPRLSTLPILFLAFFPPFNHLYSRAFMFVVLIFSNI